MWCHLSILADHCSAVIIEHSVASRGHDSSHIWYNVALLIFDKATYHSMMIMAFIMIPSDQVRLHKTLGRGRHHCNSLETFIDIHLTRILFDNVMTVLQFLVIMMIMMIRFHRIWWLCCSLCNPVESHCICHQRTEGSRSPEIEVRENENSRSMLCQRVNRPRSSSFDVNR